MPHRERQGGRRTFIFCSSIALYPPLLQVAEIIASNHGLAGHVIAPRETRTSNHPATFWGLNHDKAAHPDTQLQLHFLPARHGDVERWGFEPHQLSDTLEQLNPDYIWIHDEFWQGVAQQILWYYRFRRKPRIIAYVAVNHIKQAVPLFSGKYPFFSRTRFKQIFLWPRLNGVAACAGKSKECARLMGLPRKVPVRVNYLPVLGPEAASPRGRDLPWPERGDSFVVGFAGLINEQKGWKVLLEAMELLPPRFKVVLAGDGEQRGQMENWLERPGLHNRAYYAGLLAKEQLLATYPQFDLFVLPSVTTLESVEQFGAVLAEAMACGVPVLGSDSGAIPEVVDECGLIFPEGNAMALAQAIHKICEDREWRQQAITCGLELFSSKYSCEAYARSIAEMLSLQ